MAARASGINDDIRRAHPHLLYDRLNLRVHTMLKGDVFARMRVRAKEAETSMSIIRTILVGRYEGEPSQPLFHSQQGQI